MAETGAKAEPPAMGPMRRLGNILGGSAGNLVEWFDWFAYASFSVYFAPIFFPQGDRTSQLLGTAAIFGVGFLARPAGAWLIGLYADRHGRRAALSLSVGLMCLGSLVIALTPGHASIGAAAPVILLLARILQGLSVGGEFGASATYVSEMSGSGRRGFWSGFLYVTLVGGQLLAVLLLLFLQSILSAEELQAWGWRIAFIVGAALAIVVFWIRRGIHETSEFTDLAPAQASRSRTMMLFMEHPRETAIIVLLTAGGGVGFYAYTTYMQKFLINSAAGPAGAGFSRDAASQIMTVALVAFMVFQPLVGAISDKVGRKPVMMASFAGGALLAYPIFTAIGQATSIVQAMMLCVIPLLMLSGYTALSAVVKAELYPAHVRALGVALPYALAQAVFGGSAEFVALRFKQVGNESGFYVLLAALMGVGFLVSWRMRDTAVHSRIRSD